MKLKKREVYGAVIVDIHGKLLGGSDSDKLHRFVKGVLDEGKKKIVFNLKNVPWVNSLGIGMLIGAHTSIRNAGGELAMIHVENRIQSLLVVTKLLLIFKTFDSEEGAVKYLTERSGQDGSTPPEVQAPSRG